MAAAKQATLLGLRGIALSSTITIDEPNFDLLKPSLEEVLALLLYDNKELCLVNVNFPDRKPKGLRWTRQSVRHYDGKIVTGEDPLGRKHFWFSVVPVEGTEEGTDRWAVEQGYVSLTPLRLDLTNERDCRLCWRVIHWSDPWPQAGSPPRRRELLRRFTNLNSLGR